MGAFFNHFGEDSPSDDLPDAAGMEHVLPVHPVVQTQVPLTGSQRPLAEQSLEQFCAQPSPYVPARHSAVTASTIILSETHSFSLSRVVFDF